MKNFYYLARETPQGPFSTRELHLLACAKHIHGDTLVCQEGDAEWKRFDSHPALFPAIAASQSTESSTDYPITPFGLFLLLTLIALVFSPVFYSVSDIRTTFSPSPKSEYQQTNRISGDETVEVKHASIEQNIPWLCFFTKRSHQRDAYRAACVAIQETLKSPGSAVFAPFEQIAISGEGVVSLQGWVDSQNGFGALVRENFDVTLRDNGGAWWFDEILVRQRK